VQKVEQPACLVFPDYVPDLKKLVMIKVGILGVGRIGKIHLRNLAATRQGVEVVAAMNPSEAGQAFARQYRVPLVTSDPGKVLEHPDIDAVIISSPTPTHADYVLRAAKAGKAIFCEKPLDLSLDKVRHTLQLVREAGVPLMLAFNQRFDPTFAGIREAVQAGNIGHPHLLRIVSRDPAPPPLSYIRSSGGMFLDMTIHDFDMARYLLGGKVVEVYAKGYNLLDPEIGRAGDIDTGVVVLTFDTKATAIIENSRQSSYGYDQRLEIFGSTGMLRAENPLKDTHYYSNSAGTHQARHLDFFMDRYALSYEQELEAFLQALREKKPMPVTGEDGLQAMVIAEAANASLQQNRAVRLAD
jgi:myo-inositol 2-dehydrogenase / D-chiro-inositol 1-dehydrogenase